MRVLIVEDEPAVADLLERTLREATWATDVVGTGAAAIEAMSVVNYDLAVLDVGLPDMSGFDVCRTWRTQGGKTPVLILTARQELRDRVTGLDAGADDYLGKPFAVQELMARLRALARRPPSTLDVRLKLADLEMNTAGRTVSRAGKSIKLTAREYALLEYLLRNQGRVVTRGQILEHVWDDNFDPVGNVIDVLVGRLRHKVDLPDMPPLIHTRRGAGYQVTDMTGDDAV